MFDSEDQDQETPWWGWWMMGGDGGGDRLVQFLVPSYKIKSLT